jgi:hypothetical protein
MQGSNLRLLACEKTRDCALLAFIQGLLQVA